VAFGKTWGRLVSNWSKRAVKTETRPDDGPRGSRLPSGKRPWQFLLMLLLLFMLTATICAVLPRVARRFPFETFVFVVVLSIGGISIVLYIGQLVIVGWVVDLVDFLSEIGMPKIKARPVPLECEHVGEIIVVKLRDNIASIQQCQSVQKQLTCLIDEHHCDFVLDFSCAGRISRSFRGAMVHLMKAAHKEAGELSKPYCPLALAHEAVFKVFDDRAHAVEEMSKHEGHGWVVLCSVPLGIRAFSGLT
jgi:hypothetical protein